MSRSDRAFPVRSASSLEDAFKEYVSRCTLTLQEVFGKSSVAADDFRVWLDDLVREDPDQKVLILHQEPLYTAAEYLGIDDAALETTLYDSRYSILAASHHWHDLH